MSREINPFGLRMPPELREKIEASAEELGRSMNAEIVQRLERSFEPVTSSATGRGDDLRQILDRLDRQRQELDDARLSVFSSIYGRRLRELMGDGLSEDEASRRAYLEAHREAHPE